MPNTKLLIGAGAAGLAALAAAGVATGVLRGAGSPSSQPDVASPDAERAIVASFPAAGQAHARALVLQRTPDGYVCLWDSPDGSVAKGLGGCNPASDPLGGRKLMVNLAYDGGPRASTVRDARLSGLAAAGVASAEVVMSDGSSRPLRLLRPGTRALAGADYAVIAYRVRESDLRAGATPVAVVVRDASGRELDRQTTGIGG